MEVRDAIHERKSIRAFAGIPVSRADIEAILEAGIAAPSKGNCQPWEFYVLSGKAKSDLDGMLLNLLKTDLIPSMKLSESGDAKATEAQSRAERRSARNKAEISGVLAARGLTFDDFMLEGTFSFFNSPTAILVYVDGAFAKDLTHILSVGAAVQNMLLAATGLGLGACWIGGVWRYTKEINAKLSIPAEKRLMSSIALGYADEGSPMVGYKSTRDPISEFVKWIGFEE